MMRRRWLGIAAAVLALAAAYWFAPALLARSRPPIRVGLLHSMTGPMAISEASMVDAEAMALEELNAQGGLLGRRVEWVVADGRSDPTVFAREAERLIRDEKVSAIFGCWTSACRKAVKAVVERENHLLIYPVAYEGLEQSPNIIYVGAAPNQQVVPTVRWAFDVLKARSIYLIGVDSVGSRCVNAIIKDQLNALGASLAGEAYLAADAPDVDAAVKALIDAKPDAVLSTIEGELNVPFYTRLRGGPGRPGSKIPVVSYSVAEDELRKLPAKEMTADYAVCNYFQSIDRPENHEFVRRFRARFGADRVTSDAIASAYSSVVLWGEGAREAEADGASAVREAMLSQSLNAPEGIISIDRDTQHTWRPFFVGRIKADGQVEILTKFAKPIRPVPFPFSRTRREWESFLDALQAGWNGQWTPPAGRGPGGRGAG